MEIEHTPLWREVTAIIQGGSLPVHFQLQLEVHVMATGLSYTAQKVVSRDVVSDYINHYAATTIVETLFPAGQFAYRIYKFKDNLEATLTLTPIGEVRDSNDPSKAPSSQRFKALLIDNGSPNFERGGASQLAENTLDMTGPVTVQFQLVDRLLIQMMAKEVGTVFRGTKPGPALRAFLTSESQKIKIDNQLALQGVDMVEATNQEVYEQIPIPQGTRLVDVPQFMQHKECGIYSAGLGYFLHANHWYIYPCYDTKRFNSSPRKLTVIVIPPNRLPGIERTYRIAGNNVVVLATGEIHHKDTTAKRRVATGNGIRFSDANQFMEGYAKVDGGKAIADRSQLSTEMVTDDQPDKKNFAPTAAKTITANPYVEFSELAKRNVGLLSLVWENGNPDVLTPGMPVRVMYINNNNIETIDGVLAGVHEFLHLSSPGLTSNRYTSNINLNFFVEGQRMSAV